MRIGLIILTALLLTGCARFKPQPISPEKNAVAFEQRSLQDESFHRYAETNLHRVYPTWPPATWDLETLTLAAFYFNPDLAVARANYESVTAGKVTAGQRPNPVVNVLPAYNTSTAIPSPWLVTANLDVPIETAGKRGYRLAQAGHLSDAARFALATAAWDVRVRLRQALVELWMAQESESLLRRQCDVQESLVRLLEEEVAVGGIAPVEVSRERMALEQARLSLLDAGSRRAQARTQVAGAIGLPASALEAAPISFEVFNHPPLELPSADARRRALLSRTDILGALAEYAASESTLQLEIARQYPDIHLSPNYEYDQGDNKWGIGLNVDLPILNHNRGQIAEAQARRKESAAKFNALQAQVIGKIESALAGCENARQKNAVAAALLAQSQGQEKAVTAQFKAGEVSKQSVLSAQLESANAGMVRLDALFKVQQAEAVLENALQSPLELPASLVASPSEKSFRP